MCTSWLSVPLQSILLVLYRLTEIQSSISCDRKLASTEAAVNISLTSLPFWRDSASVCSFSSWIASFTTAALHYHIPVHRGSHPTGSLEGQRQIPQLSRCPHLGEEKSQSKICLETQAKWLKPSLAYGGADSYIQVEHLHWLQFQKDVMCWSCIPTTGQWCRKGMANQDTWGAENTQTDGFSSPILFNTGRKCALLP